MYVCIRHKFVCMFVRVFKLIMLTLTLYYFSGFQDSIYFFIFFIFFSFSFYYYFFFFYLFISFLFSYLFDVFKFLFAKKKFRFFSLTAIYMNN